MPRLYPQSHLCHGQLVGFSVKLFGNNPTYCVFFRTKDGRRVRRDTNQTRMGQAVEAARTIIEEEYAPAGAQPDRVTWDDAVVRLKARFAASGNRTSTLGYYLKLIRLVRAKYCATDGPADISPGMAARWRDTMMSTPGRRKKLPSARYVAGLVGGLSALWQKWFMDDLKILAGNPWQDVEPPKADKLPVKYATDDQIEQFYAWVEGRFAGWPFPKLFLSAKAYTGCRLMDLCGLKSPQLRGVRLVFPAHLTKGRKERAVPLPADLFTALDAFKGETWLWENYLPGLKAALKAKGFPTHQLNPEFSPQRLYYWVETLFADYRTAHGDRPTLTTHMFRKRAFTMAWKAGIDMRQASIAYGCNLDTLMRHYVALDEQQVTDDVFARMHGGKKEANPDKKEDEGREKS
jgi:integrase